MLFSVEQAFVGREEIRSPLKTPAGEAISMAEDMNNYIFRTILGHGKHTP